MKQSKADFLTFNDGIVKLFETDDNDAIIENSGKAFHFGIEKMGIQRYYAARQNDIELKRVIHIAWNLEVTTQHAAVIEKTRYKIEMVQPDKATKPPCTVLSLSQRGLWEGKSNVDSRLC